jgi:transcriptional regulator with XRE-family HTH domain
MWFIKTTRIGNMKFGEKLSFLRKQQGMTQMDLAEKLDVSRQAVSRWESGAAFP